MTPLALVEDQPGTPVKLSPTERLESLCDPGSLMVIRSRVNSRSAMRSRPDDGVVAAAGTVAGRPIYCYAQDQSFAGGSLGGAHAGSIARVIGLANDSGVPIIGFVASGGARMDEGTAGLAGYGTIFKQQVAASGWVPQITVVTGISAGGGAYSPALNDFVVMTDDSAMFLTGPGVVAEVMGEDVSMAELGGPGVHSRNGVCDLVAPDDPGAISTVGELLGFLPQNAEETSPFHLPEDAGGTDPGAAVPAQARKVYDVRTVIRCIADGGRMLELAPRWARNMVTGFTRIDGRAVAVIANQPKHLGGVIDSDAAEKAARFVRTANDFGIPLLVLVDTPGFLPGTKQERHGVIRHGAGLLRAFASATVPKVSVVLRKAYGGGVITMNSRALGADIVMGWTTSEIGVVGAKQAVGIINRQDIAAAEDPEAERERLAVEYATEHLDPSMAAGCGFVDELIEPTETRERVAWALRSLGDRRRTRR